MRITWLLQHWRCYVKGIYFAIDFANIVSRGLVGNLILPHLILILVSQLYLLTYISEQAGCSGRVSTRVSMHVYHIRSSSDVQPLRTEQKPWGGRNRAW